MILVIGLGTPDRGDDAAGLLVAERVRTATSPREVTVREFAGDPLALLDAWSDAEDVYLVDAVRSGGRPGTVYRFDATRQLANRYLNQDTRRVSLASVIELARALGRLPRRLTCYGIEGAQWKPGAPVSREVMAAVEAVASLLRYELRAGAVTSCLGIVAPRQRRSGLVTSAPGTLAGRRNASSGGASA